jgi:hypothetical protein
MARLLHLTGLDRAFPMYPTTTGTDTGEATSGAAAAC